MIKWIFLSIFLYCVLNEDENGMEWERTKMASFHCMLSWNKNAPVKSLITRNYVEVIRSTNGRASKVWRCTMYGKFMHSECKCKSKKKNNNTRIQMLIEKKSEWERKEKTLHSDASRTKATSQVLVYANCIDNNFFQNEANLLWA